MKINKSIIFCFVIAEFVSCNNIKSNQVPVEKPSLILSSFMNFWYYWNDNVKLSENYIALDENHKQLQKGTFLKDLTTGNFLPLRMESADADYVYLLYKIPDTANSNISHTITQMAGYHYHYFQLEGKPLPDFNFVDLNGNRYDPQTCKNKIIVINSWFIDCHACREEMPALNQLVDSFKNRKDILFVSLAYDSPDQLRSFLTKTKFNYAIVPNMETYLIDTLGIQISPAHFIINRKGIVVNITNDYHQMEDALKREIGHLAHNYKK